MRHIFFFFHNVQALGTCTNMKCKLQIRYIYPFRVMSRGLVQLLFFFCVVFFFVYFLPCMSFLKALVQPVLCHSWVAPAPLPRRRRPSRGRPCPLCARNAGCGQAICGYYLLSPGSGGILLCGRGPSLICTLGLVNFNVAFCLRHSWRFAFPGVCRTNCRFYASAFCGRLFSLLWSEMPSTPPLFTFLNIAVRGWAVAEGNTLPKCLAFAFRRVVY